MINPVEAREASLDEFSTLKTDYAVPQEVAVLSGFNQFDEKQLEAFITQYGLAMDLADLQFCQAYFRSVDRDPTITEIKVIDTYWSDHCRHTTFNTIIDNVRFEDETIASTFEEYRKTRQELERTKPVTLMDIGTIAAKYLKKKGLLSKLDESEEINACTVKIDVEVNGKRSHGCCCLKMRPTIIRRRSSRLAAQPPVSAAPFVIRCLDGAMFMRQCGLPALQILCSRFRKRWKANCRRERSLQRRLTATAPMATRSVLPQDR